MLLASFGSIKEALLILLNTPLALVGGLVISTALTLLVLPVLYSWLHREPVRY